MIKFQIGGSPCTRWSIAQNKNRETEPEGIGWELFENYLIAKEKFNPDFFLYENNKSAAQAIKDQISHELQVPLQYINSALVSAQNRQRFYAHNIPNVPQPEDQGILLRHILENTDGSANTIHPFGVNENGKAYCLTANYFKGNPPHSTLKDKKRTMVAERVELEAYAGRVVGRRINERGHRDDYNTSIPRIQRFEVNENPQKTNTVSTVEKDNMIAVKVDGMDGVQKVYEVSNGIITFNGVLYEINLPDGFYVIRKLSVTECCRLQTLPDDYCRAVSATQAYKGLGNGWTANVIMHILKYANIPLDEEIIVLSMYDGIGTGRYCFDKLGYKNVKYYAYEIDKFAIQIAQSNYPDIIQCGDAFQVRNNGWKIKEERGERRANLSDMRKDSRSTAALGALS